MDPLVERGCVDGEMVEMNFFKERERLGMNVSIFCFQFSLQIKNRTHFLLGTIFDGRRPIVRKDVNIFQCMGQRVFPILSDSVLNDCHERIFRRRLDSGI